jgi:hypothetical protein
MREGDARMSGREILIADESQKSSDASSSRKEDANLLILIV